MTWPKVLSALESRNYRLFFFGQIVSLIGTWMTQTASLWLIYHLSGSAFMLGIIGFVGQIPIFVFAPLAGIWVDRVNRHRLLVLTQVLSMLQSIALAALMFTHLITVHWLIALTLVQGLINAIDIPVRQALVIAFVARREHVGNAIALNSSVFNLARLVGPAIGGFVINAVGAGGCYVVDAFSYLAVIVALLMMKISLPTSQREQKHPLIEMRDGFHYAFNFHPIRAVIVTIAMISFVGFSYSVLTPMFARDVFGGDAQTLGWLMSASGVGALLGATYLGTRSGIRGIGNIITFGIVLMAVGLIGFALAVYLPFALLCLAITGAGGVLMMASSNTVLQTLVEEEKRGRVMSIFTMAFTGTMPLGNLAIGSVAETIGAKTALVGSGAICLLVGLLFYRRLPAIRKAAAPLLAKLEASH